MLLRIKSAPFVTLHSANNGDSMKSLQKTLLTLLFLPCITQAESRPLKFVTLMDFKPFAWCEEGSPKGIDVEIVKNLLDRVEQRYTIECVPWKRALFSIETGKADGLFSAYKTTERSEFAIFLQHPTHMSVFNVFVRKGETFDFNNLEDLYDKKIGITAGYSINPEFDKARSSKQLDIHESNTTVSGIKMLLQGRIDAYINGKHVGLFTARNMGVIDMLEPLPQPLHRPRPAYLMLSKASDLANQASLIRQLNETLALMWTSGEIDTIINRFTLNTPSVAMPNR
jgi:polar amino acid transport system substrate-binding protein